MNLPVLPMTASILSEARKAFHNDVITNCMHGRKGTPSNADGSSRISINLAKGILEQIGVPLSGDSLTSQRAGAKFEHACAKYLRLTFGHLAHLRPGRWIIGEGKRSIAKYDQYSHLDELANLARQSPALAAALGSDYLIKPDIIVARMPEDDATINATEQLVDQETARLTSLRAVNNKSLILHASVSCKWSIRSDRSQNARSEGLNLVRNRKGRLPHVVVITAEPLPSRLASIALGTGDIDCVYHFALSELRVAAQPYSDAEEMLNILVEGKRLRDIADLPLDLVI